MHFEAESNGNHYEISVREERTSWRVGIRPQDGDWGYHEIPKKNYQKIEEAISFIYDNSSYLVDVVGKDNDYDVFTRGTYRSIKIYNDESILHESLKSGGKIGGDDSLTSGMPGKILKVFVEPGQEVKEGEPLLIMEAMKMENEMRATHDVVISEVHVKPDENVESGVLLISFE